MKTNEIQAIENKYGMMLFHMAFTHLIDVGHRHMSNPELVAENCKAIRETTKPNSIMTADFQCSLMKCAAELTQFSIDDLLRYVKTDFGFDGLTMGGEETKWKEYLMNAITYLLETTYEEIPKDELISIIGKDIGINEKELNEIGIYIDEEGIMFDNYTNGGMTLKVDGKDIFLSTAVINELHRQENIQWGTDITANYSGDFDKAFEDITDDEFEAIAETLEEKMMSNNGEMELEAIKEVLGLE